MVVGVGDLVPDVLDACVVGRLPDVDVASVNSGGVPFRYSLETPPHCWNVEHPQVTTSGT